MNKQIYKKFNIWTILETMFKFIPFGLLMLFIVIAIDSFINKNIFQAFILIIVGVLFYLVFSLFINIFSTKKSLYFAQTFEITFILFGIVSICTYIAYSKIPNKAETYGIVIDLEENMNHDNKYVPTIYYFVDGERYNKKFNGLYTKFQIGEKVLVIYNRENPTQATLNCDELIGMGIVFIAAGLILHFKRNIDKKNNNNNDNNDIDVGQRLNNF